MSDRRKDAIERFDRILAAFQAKATPLMAELMACQSLVEDGKVLPLELRDALQLELDRCRSMIRAAKPYRACPHCYGVEAIKATCRPCRGEGWVTKNVWQLCEANVKAELEGAAHAG